MRQIATLLAMVYAIPAAALTVIQVDGPVTDIQPYLVHIQPKQQPLTGEDMMLTNTGTHVFAPSLPVKPAPLKVGKIKRQLAHYPNLVQPIFLIGKDATSLDWLEKHKTRLQKLKAIGFLIEANTPEEWKSIQASVPPEITIIPANGSIFVKRFKIEHYPVLISQEMIEQ